MAMKPVMSDEYVKELSTATRFMAIMALALGSMALGAGAYRSFADKPYDGNLVTLGIVFLVWWSVLMARFRTLQESAEIYKAIKLGT